MGLFRCNIDRDMINTGSAVKPFLSARVEVRDYYCGRIKYCTITTEKLMDNIGDESRPWYVKTFDGVRVKLFGIKLSIKEQNWKFSKL